MIFSYGLVLGLFLLAPGLGTYAGLFFGVHRGAFRPGAPAPGSVLTLGVIVLGALAAHTLWALICAANDVWAAHGLPAPLPAIPSAYAVLLSAADHRALGGAGATVFLATCAALTAAAFGLTAWTVQWTPVRPLYMRLIYGWLSDLVERAGGEPFVNAFVVTDTQTGNLVLGYEGAVASLSVNADKQITAIVLSDAVAFYLRLGEAAVERIPIQRETPIALIYLEQRQVRNIAFRVYAFED